MAELSDVIRVFISSKQREFVEERQGMAAIVRGLPLLAVDVAEEWAPGRETIEATYLARVRAAPIYVGLFGCLHSAATLREYETAIENPYREVLTYVKQCTEIEAPLTEFVRRLDDPREGHTVKRYQTWTDLKPHFEGHLWSAVRRMIENYISLSEARPVARSKFGVMEARWERARTHMLGLGLPAAGDRAHARLWAARLDEMLGAQQLK